MDSVPFFSINSGMILQKLQKGIIIRFHEFEFIVKYAT